MPGNYIISMIQANTSSWSYTLMPVYVHISSLPFIDNTVVDFLLMITSASTDINTTKTTNRMAQIIPTAIPTVWAMAACCVSPRTKKDCL